MPSDQLSVQYYSSLPVQHRSSVKLQCKTAPPYKEATQLQYNLQGRLSTNQLITTRTFTHKGGLRQPKASYHLSDTAEILKLTGKSQGTKAT